MAKITELKDRETGEVFYPVTSARAVFSDAGLNMHDELDRAKLRLFIDLWNAAAGSYGCYNERTGFFELNGLTDIGYEEALGIYTLSAHNVCVGNGDPVLYKYPYRTAFPLQLQNYNSVSCLAAMSPNLEVLVIRQSPVPYLSMTETFANCPKLRLIEGAFSCNNAGRATFQNCTSLEEVRVSRCQNNISFAQSPKISHDSLKFLINMRYDSDAFTVTVHQDTFAKLTGDTTNEAAAALSEEELGQWMELLDLAAEKNITFATS